MPEIELLKPHTHAGQALAPGQRLTVSDRQAAWLQELGVARPIVAPEPKPGPSGAEGPAPAPVDPEPEPVDAASGQRPGRVHRGLKPVPSGAEGPAPNP